MILGFTQNLVPLNLKVNFVMYILQFRKEEVSAKGKKEEKEKEKNPQNPIPTAFWDLGAKGSRSQGTAAGAAGGGAVPPPATRGRQRPAGLDLRLKSQAGWAALPPQPPKSARLSSVSKATAGRGDPGVCASHPEGRPGSLPGEAVRMRGKLSPSPPQH